MFGGLEDGAEREKRERAKEKGGAINWLAFSFSVFCLLTLCSSSSSSLNLYLFHRQNQNQNQNSAPGRLASATEEQPESKQAKSLKPKKKKKLNTKRVAGPVTVVALDAAVASPSGATRELFTSSLFFLSVSRRQRSLLLALWAFRKRKIQTHDETKF